MTDRHPAPETPVNRQRLMFLAISGYLIASFLWRAATPAHEYAMRDELYLTMGLDLLMVAGLIGLKMRMAGGKSRSRSPSSPGSASSRFA